MTRCMRNVLTQTARFVLLILMAQGAWADHDNDTNTEYPSDTAEFDYAQVLDAQPVMEVVRVPDNNQVCEDRTVTRRVPERRSNGPAIFGSILGGVIGSQFGGGHGRTAATIAGAAIGGAIAKDAQRHHYPTRYYDTVVKQCHTETNWQYEERVAGWDVSWSYRGNTYQSRMDEHPGERIKVRVSVDPIIQ